MNTTINSLYKSLTHDQIVIGKLPDSIARFIGRKIKKLTVSGIVTFEFFKRLFYLSYLVT